MPPPDAEAEDARFDWVQERLVNLLRVKPGELKKFWSVEDNRSNLLSFFDSPEERAAFIYYSGASLVATLQPPSNLKRKSLYFLKPRPMQVKLDNITTSVVAGDLSESPLESLSRVSEEVYFPLLCNDLNMEGLPEVVTKEVLESFNKFTASVYMTIGQTQGTTLLPLPPADTYSVKASKMKRVKDRIHALESSVVTWTRQIKNILKMDPESCLRGGQHPGPLVELRFWESKAHNLNAIWDQLCGDKITTIMKILEASKSTYLPSFKKLIDEVKYAREESNNNVKHLSVLRAEFDKLSIESHSHLDFADLSPVFGRILHLLHLIWRYSKHYSTPSRLVVVIREICNSIVEQAREFVNCEEIFRIDPPEAVDRLKVTLKICGAFKSCYFDYKKKIATDCPDNPWRIQNSALFYRLDSFLERCHDIRDLLESAVQFGRLEKIEIGGTKGKTLSQSVQQLFNDFSNSFAKFQELPYDLLDVEVKQFDDDFYEFRCVMKELEGRLGSILSQGFDDCATVFQAFKLVESFEGLLEREIIAADVEKKQSDLLRSYHADLKKVQDQFMGSRDKPPVHSNLPPTSGSLLWCRELLDRVTEPMNKFKQINPAILEIEESVEIVKLYEAVSSHLREYEKGQYEKWAGEVSQVSAEKLKQYLLVREEETQLVKVNFDPELVRLLREVSYLEKINSDRVDDDKLSIPKEVVDIYQKAEVYRRQTGKLELIVNMYNGILTSLLDVERPLLEAKLKAIDDGLQKGLTTLSWKGYGIDEFIASAMTSVKDANQILSLLKTNVTGIQKILQSWSAEPLLERKEGKVYDPKEFDVRFRELLTQRESKMRESGANIHVKLSQSHKALKGISKGSPAWKSYVEYVNNIVVEGVRKTVITSLVYLIEQIDPNVIQRQEIGPLLRILLELVVQGTTEEETDESAQFTPALRDIGSYSVESIVNSWVSGFFSVGTFVTRLDTGEGTYAADLDSCEDIRKHMETLEKLLKDNASTCDAFRDLFLRYSFLWMHDTHAAFAEFLKSECEERQNEPSLEKFDEKISYYEGLQHDIQKLPNSEDVGWLQIDAKPMKNALSSTCGKWKASYTGYLEDKVVGGLRRLEDFISGGGTEHAKTAKCL